MRCVRCGKEVKKAVEGQCRECMLLNEEFLKGVNLKKIKICSECNRIMIKGSWIEYKSDIDLAEKALDIDVIEGGKYKIIDAVLGKRLEIKVQISAGKIKKEYVIELMKEGVTCSRCSKKGTKYFEAVLQLRNVRDEVIEFAESKLSTAGEKGVYLNKVENIKGGADLYITSQGFARRLGQELAARFGGELSVNEKLFSMSKQTSKELFRLSVLLRGYGIIKGDVIKVDGKLVKVKGVGNKFSGVNLKDGKNVSFKGDKFEKSEIMKTRISKIRPHIEVLHPETYQSVMIENDAYVKEIKDKLNVGENVKVVSDEGRVYLL